MKHLERVAGIVGALLFGVSAFLVVSSRSEQRARRARHAPVEELAEELKQAWAGYHNR